MIRKEHIIFANPVAHRGFHNASVDENSIEAFKLAIAAKHNIEIDVHLTADDQVVVIHDASLKRVTGHDFNVGDLTYEEIQKCLLYKTQTPPPLLSEVLALINGKVGLLVEVKAEGKFPPHLVSEVLKVLSSYKYPETIALQSFNPYVVKELKTNTQKIIVGQLISDELPGQSKLIHFLFRSLLVLKISKPDFFAYDIEYITKRKIQRKRRKLPLFAWTINTEEKKTKAKKYADNIIFELIEP